jgi:hypothetical protein
MRTSIRAVLVAASSVALFACSSAQADGEVETASSESALDELDETAGLSFPGPERPLPPLPRDAGKDASTEASTDADGDGIDGGDADAGEDHDGGSVEGDGDAATTADAAVRPPDAGADDADPAHSTFFTARRDLRLCAMPFCGGYFVKRVNRDTTVCHDGVARSECYVTNIDLARGLAVPGERSNEMSLLASSGRALFRGEIRATVVRPGVELGTFVASEVWRGVTGAAPVGLTHRLRDEGLVCVRAPCLTVDGRVLNTKRATRYAQVELPLSGVSRDDAAAARRALVTHDGLLAAGALRLPDPTRPIERGTFAASEFYLRVAPLAIHDPRPIPLPWVDRLAGADANRPTE